MRCVPGLISLIIFLMLGTLVPAQSKYPVVWCLNDMSNIGGYVPIIIGKPVLEIDDRYTSLFFNGESDGIIMPVNPLQKLKKFTIEVLFKPSLDGTREQRFVHVQDKNGNRGLIEIRLENGEWWLDTYLHVGKTDKGFTLVEKTRRHACNQWYWAALVYDGKTMKHYLDAEEELTGEIDFRPMNSGVTSIGVRLNQLFWFRGNISEIRVHSKVLPVEKLQKVIK